MRLAAVIFSLFALATLTGAGQDLHPTIVVNPKSGLRTWESGAGQRPLLLLHGYGAAPQDWLPFTATIQLPAAGRFVFPEAPEGTQPPDGPLGGRAWWRLNLSSYWKPRSSVPDLSRAHPGGLVASAAQVRTLLRELETRLRCAPDQLTLGGFSQGAMVSAEIAFTTDEPLHALILLSPTFVDETAWTKAMPRRRGLPVFIAHGRRDEILPFASAERLAASMQRAGLTVTWVPFDGIHEIPASVVTELNRFLASIPATPQGARPPAR